MLDYLEMLKFLDIQVRVAKNLVGESECRRPVVMPSKKTVTRPSYVVIINDTCMGCRQASIQHLQNVPSTLARIKVGHGQGQPGTC